MGEQEKILLLINSWGYLNTKQISLLLNKKENITYKFVQKLVSNKFLNFYIHCRRKIIIL